MKALDLTDRKILNILQEDCNIPVKQIAERIELSFTATYERIKTMKANGVIAKYAAILDRELAGYTITAFCNISLKEHSHEKLTMFEDAIRSQPNVLEVVSLSGTYDYMIKVVAENISAYNEFMTHVVANIPNIGQYHSHIVLSTIKEETKLPLPG